MWRAVSFAEAAPHLSAAMGADADFLAAQVAAGEAECWQAGGLWMLTRLEQDATGKALVLVCTAGRGLSGLTGEIMAVARRAGCKSIRFHAAGDAHHLGRMARYYRRHLGRFNPHLVEQVYRIGVPHGE